MTVLDAASVHHAWQDRFMRPIEGAAAHRRIVARKDEETSLADYVLCTSEFARASYMEAGVPPECVHAISLGVDTERFQISHRVEETKVEHKDLQFVFVGNGAPLKGLDLLRTAVESLRSAGRRVLVTIIGGAAELPEVAGNDAFQCIRWMNHRQLADELPKHDVLVLPSRFDSFGMAVAEAMACGLPAIVTENVGAKEMVVPNESGLIIPANDASALARAMTWFIDHRDSLPAMSAAARAAAERYDWSAYRSRVVAFFSQLEKSR